ncbi:nitrile hydratase accessory protein [Rhizobium leguminosarum]|uniref:nitrile hydratase accessory protein n=1 Tax=Rhizobium leguminosarum TaxID=384 RepID=UPI003ECC5F75
MNTHIGGRNDISDIVADATSFSEPWQAEAFAVTVELSRAGGFSWTDWVAVFSTEIKRNPQRSDEEVNTAYYRQWMSALETIMAERRLLTPVEIAGCQEHWRRSYFNTPHGKPVEFSRTWGKIPAEELAELGHDHNHHRDHGCGDHEHHHAGPVAVSPAVGQ